MENNKHLRKLLQLTQTSGDATSSSPFASSIALTIFVLLIALFFMAFFSVFIRHFSDDDSTAEISSSPTMSPRRRSMSSRRMGLDSQAVRSLPVYCYTKEAKQRIEDCVICLSEFEEGETVKVIPYCGHVFHVICVDTWLNSHVSCPFCRSSHLFTNQVSAEEHNTCAGVVPCLRKCSSCSSLDQRNGLKRSLSF